MNPKVQKELSQPLLEVCQVSKSFPGVRALRDVSLKLFPGEVLAVIGENGAGKSTLMKVVAGIQQPDTGRLCIGGQAVLMESTRDARRLGIALIHQELALADNLDVGSNLFLGCEPRHGIFLDRHRQDREAARALSRVGLECSPRTPLVSLSPGRQQLVEIARALIAGARIIIMDEPTSSLSQGEADRLYQLIRDLKSDGVGILYISHRLGEVRELADRVTVLRDGCNAGELQAREINHDAMVRLMVGRDIVQQERPCRSRGQPLLEVQGLRTLAHPSRTIDFNVRPGEIVGMAGLVGSGRSEILRAIFGIDPRVSGVVRVAGDEVPPHSPPRAIVHGLGFVPEDRKHEGIFLEMSVGENATIASIGRRSRWGLIRPSEERRTALDLMQQLDVRPMQPGQTAQFLSGGNQQKIVLAKWLALKPRVLLLDEPTRGVDILAKQEIYRMIESLAANGVAILFVSSELEEVLRLSDRTLVLCEGHIIGELGRERLSEESVMHLATRKAN